MSNDAIFSKYIMLGHAYVPVQKMQKIFNPQDGLYKGTIFPELVSPYAPLQSMSEINYLKNYNEGGCF